MRLPTRQNAVLAVILVVAALAGCSDDETTKAGGGGGPVTLRIGTDDVQGKPASDQVEEFARRVEDLSDGEIRIKPVWHAAGDGPDWDQRVARMVTSGKLEMGMIPARSWDTEGVTSLRALNAPFLIESDELVAEVVSGELHEELLSGLDKAGVVGLALVPEGLRHPFGLKKALLGPDDYAGKTIRTPTSETTAAVFEALGATANDDEPNEATHAGVESAYVQEPVGTATGNVTFYPKVNSLVVNADAFDGLDDGQRDILEHAATQTRRWAIEENPSDAEAAAAFCDSGAAMILADEAQIGALERATQPVYDALERDEQTKRLIAAIRALKQDVAVSATAAAACPEGGDSEGAAAADAGISQLDGVYRYETTDEHLRQSGVTEPGDIADNHGVVTQTMKGGRYCWEQQAPNAVENAEACDTYAIDGDVVTFDYPAGEPDVYRWKKLANGDLKLTFVSAQPGEEGVARAIAIPVWKRIADAE